MRNLKKFLALVLAMLMVVSAAATVSAFSDVDEDNSYAAAINDLVEKEITNGVGDDKFDPDALVERYQMALYMARSLNPSESDWQAGMAIFSDVDEWYGAIAYAYMNNIVTGIGDNKFDPHAGIQYQDALIMAVRALGFKVDVSGDPYWLAAYQQAEKLGLTANVGVNKGEQTLTRAQTAQVIYNMLYATPADGGATIAAKNFGEATPANTTTFVITATPGQAYADSYKAAEDGYVGIQALVDGLPTGDVRYLPAEILGIEDDEIEDYFSYAFDFVNYNTKTGAFDKVIPGLEPVVVYNKDITATVSANKISVDGTVYYPVEQVTGAALKNEIVIFNSGDLATKAKTLLFDKDGNIVDASGDIKAIFAYETNSGVKYFADSETSKVITEASALAKYGVEIDDGTYTKYATLNTEKLYNIGNYQLTMFDDDRDGKYERAVATPVYASVYYQKNSDGYELTDGAWSTGSNTDANKNITFTEKLVKGDVFTYTYNPQLKTATVLDIIEPQTGILTKVNTTNIAGTTVGANYKAVKVTIDGVVYTLANVDRQVKGLTGASIPLDSKYPNADNTANTIKYFNNLYGLNKDGNSWNGGRPVLGFVPSHNDLIAGNAIKFIAIDNEIIAAQTYDLAADYTRVVLKDIISFDNVNVYLDLYIGGKLVEDVAVSQIDGQTLSSLNSFQLTRLLSDDALFAPGNVFRAVKLSDNSYQLSEELVTTGTTNLTAFNLKAYTGDTDKTIKFIDGIADEYYNADGTSAGDVDPEDTIRTNSNTVFYFINQKGSVTSYVGAPNKSTINFDGAGVVKVYVDKLGYNVGTTYTVGGVSSFVLVYYTESSDIKGFGVSNVDESYIYVSTTAGYVDKFDRATAEILGLGSDYSGTYYYYNVDNLAVNMGSGVEVQVVYSKAALVGGHFYSVDGNGVVKADITSSVESVPLVKGDIVQSRYYTIGSIVNQGHEVSTVKLASSAFTGTIDTNSFGQLSDTTAKTVKYIVDYEDGIFVGIVMAGAATVDNAVNAMWSTENYGNYAAISKDIVTTSTKITGKVFVAAKNGNAVSFPGYGSAVSDVTAWDGLTTDDYTYDSISITKNGTNFAGTYNVTKSVTNGVLTFSIESIRDTSDPFGTAKEFTAGNYIITINFTKDVGGATETESFIVPVVIS